MAGSINVPFGYTAHESFVGSVFAIYSIPFVTFLASAGPNLHLTNASIASMPDDTPEAVHKFPSTTHLASPTHSVVLLSAIT